MLRKYLIFDKVQHSFFQANKNSVRKSCQIKTSKRSTDLLFYFPLKTKFKGKNIHLHLFIDSLQTTTDMSAFLKYYCDGGKMQKEKSSLPQHSPSLRSFLFWLSITIVQLYTYLIYTTIYVISFIYVCMLTEIIITIEQWNVIFQLITALSKNLQKRPMLIKPVPGSILLALLMAS